VLLLCSDDKARVCGFARAL